MTEDEAFIRTIVDHPGDDLPRLVYADWLDERNDPRGAYLRAELEWARTKQTTGFLVLRMNGLAEGLDPVWVARVSRPPVGVCVEHVAFEKRRPSTDQSVLAELEGRFHIRLPGDYQAFLLNYNAVWSNTGFYRDRSGYCNPLLYIFGINPPAQVPHATAAKQKRAKLLREELDLRWRLQQIERGTSWPEWVHPVRQDFIPILCVAEEPDGEAGWLSLGVRGEHFGTVATFGHRFGTDEEYVIPIAVSFASFLSALVTRDVARPSRVIRRRLFE